MAIAAKQVTGEGGQENLAEGFADRPQMNLFDTVDSDAAMMGEGKKWRRCIENLCADLSFGFWIVLNAVALACETDLRNEENDAHIGWFISDSLFNVVSSSNWCCAWKQCDVGGFRTLGTSSPSPWSRSAASTLGFSPALGVGRGRCGW